MAKGEGRMTELREFMAERAVESGDRAGFLELHFQEATGRMTAKSYLTFQKLCTKEEWSAYEPRLMAALPETWAVERIKIGLLRGERDKAAELLSHARFSEYESGYLEAAKELEKSHPEKVLAFYKSGLGSLERPASRKEYARQARVLELIRRVMLTIIKSSEMWRWFTQEIKQKTIRWPAFQEEVTKRIPDWLER